MSVASSITMPSLIVKLPLDFSKAQYLENASKPRTLRKRVSPPAKTSVGRVTKKRSLDEVADVEHNSDDQSMDIDSESLPSPTPSKKVRRPAKKVPDVPYYTNKTVGLPDAYGEPLVWADKRQALCETLSSYYNAYQSGAYTKDGILYGFLVDGEVGPLDHFDHQIVITTVGGDRTKDPNGNTVQETASDDKASGTASMRTMANGSAVLVIAGQGNKLSPCKLYHYYNVLGWFKVTDVWRETKQKTWKIRLEKIDLCSKSWWAAKGTYPSDPAILTPNYDYSKTKSSSCQHCQQPSKEIYEQGWTCLNTLCNHFFDFNGTANTLGQLSYNAAFLEERTQYTGPAPGRIAPPLPTQQDLDNAYNPYEEKFTKGIVCPDCGCCSRRVQWHQWACENCSFVLCLNTRPVSVIQAIAQGSASKVLTEYTDPSVRSQGIAAGHWSVHEYTLPGPDESVAGWVRVFKTNRVLNQQPGGADELFQQMQQDHFKLTRNGSRNKGKPSEILTSHFASNWGALYKYSVTPNTTGFDEAPLPIIKALKRLTWAGEHALTNEMDLFEPFNELLAIGYTERGHMDYHDDGEKTLGPTVATLSLGCNALMKFRPKKKSPIGKSGKGAKGVKPDSLKIVLNHGDLLVMHGTDIHKYYEHAVDPNGNLRFALTARFIRLDKMDKADRDNARRGGILPSGHEKYNYDGKLNVQPVPRAIDLQAEYNGLTQAMSQQGLMSPEIATQMTQAVNTVLSQA